jgi:hypothetical protein
LYQVLDTEPHLIPLLLPHLWQETITGHQTALDPPSSAELTPAFETLATSFQLHQHYCFFIDGLDEFVGSYLDTIRFIKGICRNSNMKLLVFSRPIPSCVDSLAYMPKLHLHDLTRNDICKLCTG